ncbi:MAG TPA: hypothetical protein VN240_01970, partial [Propylenella sp.]|nr:hypothetical protein [Propylenella sp.]
MGVFSGSREAFQMLRRLATKGNLRNYNDVIAGELIKQGYARPHDKALVLTDEGREASLNLAIPRL